MALVVFMRAVNVGGYQNFQPAALAKKLADLDVVNIGAAGTFVVRARVSEKSLRKKMLAEMGFEPANVINGTSGYDKSHAVQTTVSPPARPPDGFDCAGSGCAGRPLAGAEWRHAAFQPSPPSSFRKAGRSGRQER